MLFVALMTIRISKFLYELVNDLSLFFSWTKKVQESKNLYHDQWTLFSLVEDLDFVLMLFRPKY